MTIRISLTVVLALVFAGEGILYSVAQRITRESS